MKNLILNTENKNRYLGPKTFTQENQIVFFGREKDTEKLSDFIIANRLSVLFGKSGLGKSSLINAGVVPILEGQRGYFPINVRFHNYTPNLQYISPLENLAITLDNQIHTDFLADFSDLGLELWKKLKNIELTSYPNKTLLLILDQFEELFTYQEADVIAFAQQFSELLNNKISKESQKALYEYIETPSRLEQIYDKMSSTPNFSMPEDFLLENEGLSEAEFKTEAILKIKELLLEPIDLKVLFAIRSDRMSQMNMIAPYIANILRNCYELKQLSNEDAKRAIIKPAEIVNASFLSPNFKYEPAAIDKILSFFASQNKEIEPFLLQIICLNIENKLVIQKGSKTIFANFISQNENENNSQDIIHLHSITKDFYLDITQKAVEESQSKLSIDKLRETLESSLVYEGKRSLALSDELMEHIGKSVVLFLENEHLIRGEQHSSGNRFYELSHDTLVAPIQKEIDNRQLLLKQHKEEEEKKRLKEAEELMRLRAEQAEIKLREDKVKQSKRLVWIGIISLVATAVWLLLLINSYQEQKRKSEADSRKLTKKDSMLSIKSDSINLVKHKINIKQQEMDNLSDKLQEDSVNWAEKVVQAEEKRLQAQKQLAEANSKLIIANTKLSNAEASIKDADSQKRIAKEDAAKAEQFKKQAEISLNEATDSLIIAKAKSKSLEIDKENLKKQVDLSTEDIAKRYAILDSLTKNNNIKGAKRILQQYREVVTDEKNTQFSNYIYWQYPDIFIHKANENEHFNGSSNNDISKGIYDINYSKDKNYILTANSNGNAYLREVASHKIIEALTHTEGVRKAIFSPDEKWIGTASLDKNVFIWNNTQNGSGISKYRELQADIPLLALDFSPDNQYVAAAGMGNYLYVWNIANPKEKYVFQFQEVESIRKIAFLDNENIAIEKVWKGKTEYIVLPFLNNDKDLIAFMKKFVR